MGVGRDALRRCGRALPLRAPAVRARSCGRVRARPSASTGRVCCSTSAAGRARSRLQLARFFRAVVGLDPDAGMIREARDLAAREGVVERHVAPSAGRGVAGRHRAGSGRDLCRVVPLDGPPTGRGRQCGGCSSRAVPSCRSTIVIKTAWLRWRGCRLHRGPDRRASPLVPRATIAVPADRSVTRLPATKPTCSAPPATRVPSGSWCPTAGWLPGRSTISCTRRSRCRARLRTFSARVIAEFESDLRRLLAEESAGGPFAERLPDNELQIWRPVVSR